MKWFFAGLLLLNIALLAWNWQRPDAPPVAVVTSAGGGGSNGLQLLSEMQSAPLPRPAQETEAIPPPAEPEPPVVVEAPVGDQAPVDTTEVPAAAVVEPAAVPPPLLCLRLTSLESRPQVDELVAALKKAGAGQVKDGLVTESRKRYWVLLPAAKNAAGTTAAIDRLKKAGIKDYYLIRSGENKNAISLGLFSNPDSAQRRLLQMRELKFKPRIEESSVAVERWWVEFHWAEARPESDWRGELPKAARKITATNCP